MGNSHILCNVNTRGRYLTTLPLTLQAVAMQTVTPDRLVIFDDNDETKDMREEPLLASMFKLLDAKGIKWEVVFGKKKGPHWNHQQAQDMATDLVWRVDDDCSPEPDCLEKLLHTMETGHRCGAVGGLILTDPAPELGDTKITGKIESVQSEPNLQWFRWSGPIRSVDHLHCSFLYRKGIANYNLDLSRVAHTEETQFTYEIKRAGYSIWINPNAINRHYQFAHGGIRSANPNRDRDITLDMHNYQSKLIEWGIRESKWKTKILYLNSGLGDHLVVKRLLPELRDKGYNDFMIANCYPEVFKDDKDVRSISIAEGNNFIRDFDKYNPYHYITNFPGTTLEEGTRRSMGL
jgi:hypothetical protein